MERFDGRSKDMVAENIAKLKELFPEALSEGKVNIDKLLAILGNEVSDDFEREFTIEWTVLPEPSL